MQQTTKEFSRYQRASIVTNFIALQHEFNFNALYLIENGFNALTEKDINEMFTIIERVKEQRKEIDDLIMNFNLTH